MEDEYVFEYTLDQLTLEYLFTSPVRWLDMIQFTSGGLLMTIAIPLNLLLLVAVVGSESLRRNPSYYFVTLMCLCDLGQLFASTYNIVYMAFRQAIVGSPFSLVNQFIFFISDAFLWCYICTLGVVALNRVICVVFPIHFKALFTTRFSKRLIIFCICFGTFLSSSHLHSCCRLLSFPEWHTTAYYPFDTWYRYLDLFFSSLCALIIIVCYSLMFYVMRTSQKYAKLRAFSRNAEWRLSLQVFLMSAVFLVTFSTYFWLPYLGESQFVALIAPTLFVVQNITHPTIAFIFNTAIRQEAMRRLGCKGSPKRGNVNPVRTPSIGDTDRF